MKRNRFIIFVFLSLSLAFACRKDSIHPEIASVTVFNVKSGLKNLNITKSINGYVLIANSSGAGDPVTAKHQQFILLDPTGKLLNEFQISDTVFQFINVVEGMDDGFLVVAANSDQHYIAWYKLDDLGKVVWTGTQPMVSSGFPLYAPAVTSYSNNEYLILYHNSGSGYYVHKLDIQGNVILNKKIPPPIAQHLNVGLNFGESVLRIFKTNDTTIFLQGEVYDQYSSVDVTNCFVRQLNDQIQHKWFSSNYDPSMQEVGAGLFINGNNELLFFGTKSEKLSLEGYGNPFIRKYSTTGQLINEQILPQTGGTPTLIKSVKRSPDGGYLLVGSNNQFLSNDVVSPNKIILVKLNSDLSVLWEKVVPTAFPGRAFDLAYLNDGTMGLVAFLKEDFTINRVMYMHLDAQGNILP